MKISTADLIGKNLDRFIAKLDGVNDEAFEVYYDPTEPSDLDSHGFAEFHYSQHWHQGGKLIPNYITKIEDYGDRWGAEGPNAPEMFGPTILIAVMRCIVNSAFGSEVEVPEEEMVE